MAEYLSPGVYVEEVSSGIKPIEGVGTSTGAFVGRAIKGPVNTATLITNFTQFINTFGGFHPDYYLPYAIQHFFAEEGTRCYVVRVFDGATADANVAKHDFNAGATPILRVSATSPGEWGNSIQVEIGNPTFHPDEEAERNAGEERKFSLTVRLKNGKLPAPIVEAYGRLSMKERTTSGLPNPLYVEDQINPVSKYIRVERPDPKSNIVDPPDNVASTELANGGNGGDPVAAEYIGDEKEMTGLHAFDVVDNINIVAIPDLVAPRKSEDRKLEVIRQTIRDATNDGFSYCEKRKDCFFVADTLSGLSPQDALAYKQGQAPFSGNAFNSTFGALYYPWIYVTDPLTGRRKLFPPSGTVDGYLNTAADVERMITKGEHDTLNPQGINVIRKFPEAGIVIWGARTVSADPEWRYVPVRRLFLFLEESIDEGTQWVVFEPNGPNLWARIVRNVSAFLRVQWLDGKLAGNTPEQAYFVKCDEETNPQESIDVGRVVTVIGVAPLKPAEFVIFRISQIRPGAKTVG
jgi:phage tail sheath protein FI